MSHLYRRGQVYWLAFYKNNKLYRKSLKTKDRVTARYLQSKQDQEITEGNSVIPSAGAVCSFLLDEYNQVNEHRRVQRVNVETRARILRFLEWGDIRSVNQITESRLQEYLNHRINNDKVSLWEANNTIAGLKAWLNWCVRSRKIFDNPIKAIKKFKTPETSRRFLTKDQIKAILKAAADPALYSDRKPVLLPFVATAIYAGLRKTELFKLDWQDIDFGHNILVVRNKEGFTTKSKKNRTIELHPKLKKILKDCRRDAGRCFDVTNYRRVFSRIARAINIPDLKLHELRHTFITQALLAGIDIPTVSEWAGHSSWITTKIYTHIHSMHKQAQIRKLSF